MLKTYSLNGHAYHMNMDVYNIQFHIYITHLQLKEKFISPFLLQSLKLRKF